jgi:hypothetical protein
MEIAKEAVDASELEYLCPRVGLVEVGAGRSGEGLRMAAGKPAGNPESPSLGRAPFSTWSILMVLVIVPQNRLASPSMRWDERSKTTPVEPNKVRRATQLTTDNKNKGIFHQNNNPN